MITVLNSMQLSLISLRLVWGESSLPCFVLFAMSFQYPRDMILVGLLRAYPTLIFGKIHKNQIKNLLKLHMCNWSFLFSRAFNNLCAHGWYSVTCFHQLNSSRSSRQNRFSPKIWVQVSRCIRDLFKSLKFQTKYGHLDATNVYPQLDTITMILVSQLCMINPIAFITC